MKFEYSQGYVFVERLFTENTEIFNKRPTPIDEINRQESLTLKPKFHKIIQLSHNYLAIIISFRGHSAPAQQSIIMKQTDYTTPQHNDDRQLLMEEEAAEVEKDILEHDPTGLEGQRQNNMSFNIDELEEKGYTLQQAYRKIGGMGKFHYFSSAMLIIGFMSGSFLGQQMQFVELLPKYKCIVQGNVQPVDCAPYAKPTDNLIGFCGNPDVLSYTIDYTNPLSLHNWIVDLKPDLTCEKQGFTSPIALLGSMQFVGWAISAAITPRLSDIYGRRPIFLASMAIQLAALIAIYISRHVWVTVGLIFVFGIGGVGRSSISYLYMQEFLPQNKQTLVGTILQLNNGFVAVYTVIYYWFISNWWIPINVFGGVLTLVSMVGVWFLPESPKFLITMKRYDEARKAITIIATVNKQQPFTSRFDREVLDEKALPLETKNSTMSPGGIGSKVDISKKAAIEESQLTGSLSDLVKIRRHLINLCILVFLWMAASFNLYMIGFYMKYIPGSIFVSTLTACLGDIPLSIAGGFLYHHKGPKIAMPIFLTVAICGSISLITWADYVKALIPVVVLITRSGIKATFDSCYLANSTIFPAIFSGTAFGICNIGAKVVTIFSPLTAEVPNPVPMVIFSSLSIVALLAASQLRVTHVKPKSRGGH